MLPYVEVDRQTATNAEAYAAQTDNAYHVAATEPLSTFSIDVDTASYSNVRRFLTNGSLPPRDAVRVEELINYFPYRYAAPTGDVPFAARLDVASAPWAPAHRLVRIGIKGRELTAATRPAANLVFLLDVSGSMNSPNKLPLVKESLRLLVERLRPDDRVAIVTYAGNSGLALPSTPASRKSEILAALDHLESGGSTNGAMGIHLAYDIAKANFATGGLNRVILCTDGDFNVGVTSPDELVSLITEKAKSRVFLSVFGYGMGNLKDSTLESLADKGNGAYGYIDTRREAEKVFVEQVDGTLATIAKDVKIQVEFNPARVASYRLVGYENRLLAKEDFNNDAVDAGDIGAGHTVTALYEIVPVDLEGEDVTPRPAVDALKYQTPVVKTRPPKTKLTGSSELLTVKIRYKAPEGDVSKKQEFPLIDTGADFAKADGDFQFAAAVAAWGLLLRDSPHKGSATFDQVLGWAENGLGDDANGHRAEFIGLVRRSAELSK
jgi:Ca-activated chloride channel family protein